MSIWLTSCCNSNSDDIKYEIKMHVNAVKKQLIINKINIVSRLDFNFFEMVLGYIYRYHKAYVNSNATILLILFTYGNPFGIVIDKLESSIGQIRPDINPSLSVLNILKKDVRLVQDYNNMIRFYTLIQNNLVKKNIFRKI